MIVRTLYATAVGGTTENVKITMPADCLVGPVAWNVFFTAPANNDVLRASLVTGAEANQPGNDRPGRISQVVANGATAAVNFQTPASYFKLEAGQDLWMYVTSSPLYAYEIFCMVTLYPVDFVRHQDHVDQTEPLKIQAPAVPALQIGQGIGEDLKALKSRGMSGQQAYEAFTDTLTDISNAIQTIYDFNYLWLSQFDLAVLQNAELALSEFIGILTNWMQFGLVGIMDFGPLGVATDVGYNSPGFANNKRRMQQTLSLTVYDLAVQNIISRLWGQNNPRKYVVEKVRKRIG